MSFTYLSRVIDISAVFLGFVNMFSVKIASRIQIIFTFTKLTAVALIIGGGIFNLSQGFGDTWQTTEAIFIL